MISTKNKIVDIVLPNYNKVRFIEECIESLLSQTYPYWRCIVVDGNSDDGSWEVIQRYANKDDRFELHQPGRLGLYPSWNCGIEKVRASYFTFLTSDDVWDPLWLETAVRVLKGSPTSEAVCARAVYVDIDTEVLGVPRLVTIADELAGRYVPATEVDGITVQKRPGPLQASLVYALGSVPITIHALVMRKHLTEMRFSEDVGSIADREWYLRMALRGPVAYVRECDAYLRKYEDQATAVTQRDRRQLARSVEIILDRNAELLRSAVQVPPDVFYQVDTVVRRMFDFLYMRPSMSMLRSDPALAISLLAQTVKTYPQLLLFEIVSVLLCGSKYSMNRRVKAAEHLLTYVMNKTSLLGSNS